MEALRKAAIRGVRGTISEQMGVPAKSLMFNTEELDKNIQATQGGPLTRRIGLGLPLSNIVATYFGKLVNN